nr:uncharacterized protein LOC124815838 [Hydra vulgaris]
MSLHCFVCGKSFSALNIMVWHLKRAHAVYEHNDIPCGQGDCPKRCSSFCNLRVHIFKYHQDLFYVNNLESKCEFSSQFLFNNINDVSIDDQFDCSVDSVDNRDERNIQDSIQKSFVSFIAKLQARSNILLTNVQFVTEGLKELLQDSLHLTLEHVRSVFNELNIDENVTCFQNLYEDLAAVTTSIDKVDTEHKIIA